MRITREDVLDYHRRDRPGKLQIAATKPLLSQRDFSLAYSPGVAHAVLALDENPLEAYDYTSKGNLVAVVTNGTAILGLGNRGPVPAKPVMEGKALLFKQLADVDVFDIELDAPQAEDIIAAVRMIAPGFGGINLEDIAAPQCFRVEEELQASLSVPVFHDDQHGTAIITGAALLNALELTGKDITTIRVVVNGAGSAGVASANMYVALGVRRENIVMFDRVGLVYEGRQQEMDPYKARFAQPCDVAPSGVPIRTLGDALVGADLLLGVSVADVVTPDMLRGMNPNPILFLLANPDPEIRYELAVETRPDAIVATGRSDYPNQVNNVLVFPFVFRGALDTRAGAITNGMKMAAAVSLAALTKEDVPDTVLRAYGLGALEFGTQYIIPKPNDPRVLEWVGAAVAEAAMGDGVARLHVDLGEYRAHLRTMQRRGWRVIDAIVEMAEADPKRVVFVEGEHPQVVRAAQGLERLEIAKPILLGREDTIRKTVAELHLHYTPEVIDVDALPHADRYAEEIYRMRQRKGVTPERAREMARRRYVYALMMVQMGQADAVLCGLSYDYPDVIRPALQLIGMRQGIGTLAGVDIVIARDRAYFLADGLVNIDPTADQIAEIAILTADFVCRLDLEPRIAMLSFSNFGSVREAGPEKMRRAAELVRERRPDLNVEGEMQPDTALSPRIMEARYPFSRVRDANVLIFPNLDSSNSSFKLLARLGGVNAVGPFLLGLNRPVQVLQAASDVDNIMHVAALAVVQAQEHQRRSTPHSAGRPEDSLTRETLAKGT